MDELFQTMADANLVEVYPDKLVEIHSYTKDDILEFLAPSTIHTERDIDDRCKVLSDLRDKLCEALCEMFPEYGSRELINRRVPHTYASDVFVIGNSIRNSMIDKV